MKRYFYRPYKKDNKPQPERWDIFDGHFSGIEPIAQTLMPDMAEKIVEALNAKR